MKIINYAKAAIIGIITGTCVRLSFQTDIVLTIVIEILVMGLLCLAYYRDTKSDLLSRMLQHEETQTSKEELYIKIDLLIDQFSKSIASIEALKDQTGQKADGIMDKCNKIVETVELHAGKMAQSSEKQQQKIHIDNIKIEEAIGKIQIVLQSFMEKNVDHTKEVSSILNENEKQLITALKDQSEGLKDYLGENICLRLELMEHATEKKLSYLSDITENISKLADYCEKIEDINNKSEDLYNLINDSQGTIIDADKKILENYKELQNAYIKEMLTISERSADTVKLLNDSYKHLNSLVMKL
jgi:hypothetical protein